MKTYYAIYKTDKDNSFCFYHYYESKDEVYFAVNFLIKVQKYSSNVIKVCEVTEKELDLGEFIYE